MDDRGGYWVERYTTRGHPFKTWKFAVPRIDDRILQCVVYLYPSRPMAEAGEGYGGSGFLVSLPVKGFEQTRNVTFAVTNKHVIDGGSTTVRLNTIDDNIDIFETTETEWLRHPKGDDLAIWPILGLSSDVHAVRTLSLNLFLTHEVVANFKIGHGDECFFVGRFINHEGKQRNTPTVRFGCIAQMPSEKIRFPDGSEHESFLVEAHSIPGYSGSPVFVQILPFMGAVGNVGRPVSNMPHGPWLLGIDHCHLFSPQSIIDKATGRPVNEDWYVRNNTGMMGVIPCWKLSEMFGLPDVLSLMEEQSGLTQNKILPGRQDGLRRFPRIRTFTNFQRDEFSTCTSKFGVDSTCAGTLDISAG